MATMGGLERSKLQLHNFDLPLLKWGKQRHLRCMKVPYSDADDCGSNDVFVGAADTRRRNRSQPSKFMNSDGFPIENDGADLRRCNRSPPVKFSAFGAFSFDNGGRDDLRRGNRPPPSKTTDSDVFYVEEDCNADRRRSKRSPPPKFMASRTFDVGQFNSPGRTRIGGGGEEGIEAVRERIMLDLKTAAKRMKAAILSKESSSSTSDDDDESHVEKRQSPSPAASLRPWNLRTRRAACKAPIGGNSAVKLTDYSPTRSESSKREREKEGEGRAKFAVALSRKEIEEDFREMVGRKPARRPKKRPRNVQKQLDPLFPGLWLTEVTLDAYKVPELP